MARRRARAARRLRLIHDAYNANPVSMTAALEALAARRDGGRAVAVLGEMSELGRGGRAWHVRVGRTAGEARVELLVGGGPAARGYLDGAAGRVACRWFADLDAATRALPGLIRPGDV